MDKLKTYLKNSRYILEAAVVKAGLILFRILGLEKSSNLGSFLARMVGKFVSVNKLAKRNLKQAMPNLDEEQVSDVLDGMWDNLGRVVGEFIHVCEFSDDDIDKFVKMDDETVKNIEYIKKNCNGGIIFSGHIGNWELGPKTLLKNGLNVKTVYRPLNNRLVDNMTSLARKTDLIAKGPQGNRDIVKEIKKGNYIIILVDQKITDGAPIKFFGRDAVTTLSIAKLAIKYDLPLIPARIIRKGKDFDFEVKVEKPIEFNAKNSTIGDSAINLMTKVNQKLESWIKEYPSQWFWVHNRWKK